MFNLCQSDPRSILDPSEKLWPDEDKAAGNFAKGDLPPHDQVSDGARRSLRQLCGVRNKKNITRA